MKILLVEDSRTSVLMVKSLLEEDTGGVYGLTVAGTLAEAKEQLETKTFDLILLDLTLPDSSGLATVDSVFAEARGTGIVVLTSTSDEAVGLAALQRGAQDFLVKDETYRKVLVRAIKYAHQRSKAEREIREAKEMAEFATRSKSSFIANLSHELRTPLNAIIGFSELMQTEAYGPLGEKYKEYAKHVHQSGRYLLGLIGTVLDLSKIEVDKMDLNEDVVDLNRVLDTVSTRLSESEALPGKPVVRVDLAPNLPSLKGDEIKITQVVTNLVGNAIKFSPDGGDVEVKAFLDGDGDLVVSVRDHGIGIAADQLEAVLSPFGRSVASKERRIEGTGLGLPLSKGLVEAHGGRLDIDSAEGEGTTVTVRFPASRLVASAA